MRKKSLSSVFLIAAFLFTIVSPVAIVQPADAAGADPIATITTKMGEVYVYLDDPGGTVDAARGKIVSLNDGDWNYIISDLLASGKVVDKYAADGKSAAYARERMILFATGMAEFYYSSDEAGLSTRLTNFKNDFRHDFRVLFGPDVSMEDLFNLLFQTRQELPDKIKPHSPKLATGTNDEILALMDVVMKQAFSDALADAKYKKISDGMFALGWTSTTIVDTQQKMAEKIDTGKAGQLALARAVIRSRTQLNSLSGGTPTPVAAVKGVSNISMTAGTSAEYQVSIFKEDTSLLAWSSSTPSVGEMVKDSKSLKVTLNAKTAGTTVITGYRAGGNATDDWLLKINLTVTSAPTPPSPSGSGSGGGGGTTIIPKKEEPKVVKEPEVKEPAKVVPFTDIQGHWAEAKIKSLQEKGIITGYPDGTFQPGKTITRAEFLVMIIKAFNLTGTDGKIFSDTGNHWAKDIISIAVHNGIATGYDDETFGPDDPITREQMAVIIAIVKHLTSNGTGKTFTDADLISAWAAASVDAVTESGLMTGYPDDSFDPQGLATRAEAAVVIYNAINQ